MSNDHSSTLAGIIIGALLTGLMLPLFHGFLTRQGKRDSVLAAFKAEIATIIEMIRYKLDQSNSFKIPLKPDAVTSVYQSYLADIGVIPEDIVGDIIRFYMLLNMIATDDPKPQLLDVSQGDFKAIPEARASGYMLLEVLALGEFVLKKIRYTQKGYIHARLCIFFIILNVIIGDMPNFYPTFFGNYALIYELVLLYASVTVFYFFSRRHVKNYEKDIARQEKEWNDKIALLLKASQGISIETEKK